MAVKLVVIYPRPKDIDAFEYIYKNEHLPMASENLTGKTKIVATKVLSSPFGTLAFHRVAEVYFPSLRALEECAASEGGNLTIAHALSISSGGTPTIFVAEEETFEFEENQDSAARSAVRS